MSVSLTHNFVSAIPDGVDTTIVRPSNWNDQHVLTMATARLLGRTTAGTGAAEEIGVTAPISLSAGALAMPAATTLVDGYLSHTDWTTFNAKGSGTVTSVAALTLGTTGTDLTSSVATGTTTPVITLNVPTASALNRGALSAADWTTFNNKGSGTVTTTGSPANGNLAKFSGGSSVTNGDLSGDLTTSGTLAVTLATVNANVGSFGSATQASTFTVNGKGLITAAGNVTVTPAVGSITGLGTGVATFLATPSSANLASAVTDETGSGALVFANSPTLVSPALGTPASGVVTNLTGTASININGTVGATTPASGSFTTATASGLVDISGASAGQIKFPATQNASADANTLDDYEEGTFTPAWTFGGASVGITYSQQDGRYTKIGRFVECEIAIVLSNKGSSAGLAIMTGLPFAIGRVCGGFPAISMASIIADQALSYYGSTGLSSLSVQNYAFNPYTNANFTNADYYLSTFVYSV